MKKKQPGDLAMDLLKLAVQRISYFEENPSHLAWVMMHYSGLLRIGRVLSEDWTNPKDAILDLKDITQAQQDLIYDAWGVTVSNDPEFNDVALPLEGKPYKTMNEWLKLKLDPKYRYKSIYRDRISVYDHLLCSIGTGMKWVEKDGVSYIADVGPAGVNEALFAGYTRVGPKVAPEIRREVLNIADQYGISAYIQKMIANGKKAARGWKWEPKGKTCVLVPPHQTTLKRLQRLIGREALQKAGLISPAGSTFGDYYPMSREYSNLMQMPKNAHPSYLHAGLRIAAEILLSPTAEERNVKLAWRFYKRTVYGLTWNPKDLLGHLSERPGRLPATQTCTKPVFKVGDWVAVSQSRRPEIGIVTRLAKSKKDCQEAKMVGSRLIGTGRRCAPWLWEVDVTVYTLSGKMLKKLHGDWHGRWLKIKPPKFPIQPDERGDWHNSVAAVYYPYPVPENTVERWLQLKKAAKKRS